MLSWVGLGQAYYDDCFSILFYTNFPNPARISLSLIALRGPECSHSKNDTSKLQSTTRTPEPSTTPTMTSEDLKRQWKASPKKRGGLPLAWKGELLSTVSSPSLRSLVKIANPSECPVIFPLPIHYNSNPNSKSFLPFTRQRSERDRKKC